MFVKHVGVAVLNTRVPHFIWYRHWSIDTVFDTPRRCCYWQIGRRRTATLSDSRMTGSVFSFERYTKECSISKL